MFAFQKIKKQESVSRDLIDPHDGIVNMQSQKDQQGSQELVQEQFQIKVLLP